MLFFKPGMNYMMSTIQAVQVLVGTGEETVYPFAKTRPGKRLHTVSIVTLVFFGKYTAVGCRICFLFSFFSFFFHVFVSLGVIAAGR